MKQEVFYHNKLVPMHKGILLAVLQLCIYPLAPTQAPMNLSITRLNSSSVLMTWDPLVSSRGVAHDITYYEIEYRLIRTDTPNPKSIVVNTTSNSTSLVLSIPQDVAAHQVMEARVKGVTQVSREPVHFLSGPFSAYQSEDDKPVIPPDTKGTSAHIPACVPVQTLLADLVC